MDQTAWETEKLHPSAGCRRRMNDGTLIELYEVARALDTLRRDA